MIDVKSYFVYMLLCADGSFYVGITSSPDCRIAQHNLGTDRKSYTFTRRPVRLVHVSEFRYVNDAIHWEKHLKGWSHAKSKHWRKMIGAQFKGSPEVSGPVILRQAQDDKGGQSG